MPTLTIEVFRQCWWAGVVGVSSFCVAVWLMFGGWLWGIAGCLVPGSRSDHSGGWRQVCPRGALPAKINRARRRVAPAPEPPSYHPTCELGTATIDTTRMLQAVSRSVRTIIKFLVIEKIGLGVTRCSVDVVAVLDASEGSYVVRCVVSRQHAMLPDRSSLLGGRADASMTCQNER